MAKNDFTTEIENGRIMFMTSYYDEFGDSQEIANIITKDRLIEIRDGINRALAELSDENSNCNIIPLVSNNEVAVCDCEVPGINDYDNGKTCVKCLLPIKQTDC